MMRKCKYICLNLIKYILFEYILCYKFMKPIRKLHWHLDSAYNDWWRKKNMNKNLHNNGYEELQKFHDLMKINNITYWLTAGTLLGFFRDKSFISHDFDIDVAADEINIPHIVKVLKKSDFRITHGFIDNLDKLTEISLESKNVKIDIFFSQCIKNQEHISVYYQKNDADVLYHGVTMYLPKVAQIHDEQVHGITVSVPDNGEEYLTAIYGPTFMIPDKNWTYTKDLYSAKYFSISEYYGKEISPEEIYARYSD